MFNILKYYISILYNDFFKYKFNKYTANIKENIENNF